MRHRRSSASLLAAIAAVGAATILTQPAFALEPGVHVSTSSPAGIEYAFPLGSARSALSGEPSGPSAASPYSAPLFGVGVGGRRVPGRRSAPRQAPPGAADAARRLDTTVQAGSAGDLAQALVAGVLLVGVLAGLLGSVPGRRALGS